VDYRERRKRKSNWAVTPRAQGQVRSAAPDQRILDIAVGSAWAEPERGSGRGCRHPGRAVTGLVPLCCERVGLPRCQAAG